jgi:hypothetical protein
MSSGPHEIRKFVYRSVRYSLRAADLLRCWDDGGRDLVDLLCPEDRFPQLDTWKRATHTEQIIRTVLDERFTGNDRQFYLHVLALDMNEEDRPSATDRFIEAGKRYRGLTTENQQRRRKWKNDRLWPLAVALREWLDANQG